MTHAGDLAGGFSALEASLRAGYPRPSDVLGSDHFVQILAAPRWRRQVYELLEANARESSISMVGPAMLGEPMTLTIRIVAGRGEPPEPVEPVVAQAGIVVGIVHVDAAGYYQPWAEEQDWNPRQFGFAVTDETGTAVFRTIRPGHYAPEYEAPEEPAHVHYNVEQRGVLLRAAEFYFEDDPRVVGEVRRAAEEKRVPVASMVRDADGVWQAKVTIPVRGLH